MILGRVDEQGHALVRVRIADPITGFALKIEAWIDTGFTGDLMLPQATIRQLQLPRGSDVEANLADGSTENLRSYTCQISWAGRSILTYVVATAGKFPLLGVKLLEDLVLTIDYPARTVTLAPSSAA